MPHKEIEANPLVDIRLKDTIGIASINNPHKANCLSHGVIQGLLDAFKYFKKNKARVVIIKAYEGAKIFSAGHDLSDFPRKGGEDPLKYTTPFEQLLHSVRNLPMPVIAMIEGSVWGGACDLAVSCDLAIGTEKSTFAITPVKVGIAYNTAGLTHFIHVLPLHIVKEMLFTGLPLSAEKALQFGLLNDLVPGNLLEKRTMELAQIIADRAPLVVQLLKAELRKITNPVINTDDFEEIQELREKIYTSKDYKEGLSAFFERRPPVFKGK